MPEDALISENIRKLIKALLQTDPDLRPTIDQVLQIIHNLQNKYKADKMNEIKEVY